MRIGVVTDAVCDLPRAFIDRHDVVILPVSVRMGEEIFADERDLERTLAFYKGLQVGKLQSAEAVPPGAEEIRDLFLQRLVIDYDFVFCITMDTLAGPMFEHATRASYAVLSGYKRIRQEAGVDGPFALRVLDSRNLFTGQGVVVADLLRRMGEDPGVGELRRHIDGFSRDVYTYVLPADITQLRSGSAVSGDQKVGWAGYMVANTLNIKPIFRVHDHGVERVFKAIGYRHGAGKLFEHTATQIKRGLKAPVVCISFGGNPQAVPKMPNFELVDKAAREHGVELLISEMSPAAAVTAGPQALSVAFAAEPHQFA